MAISFIDAIIRIGDNPNNTNVLPSGISSSMPYISWEFPNQKILQARFNIRITSLNNPNALIVSGETVTSDQFYQFPLGTTMHYDAWKGVCHIEIIVSEDPEFGEEFEYTTGSFELNKNGCFVYDNVIENIYSKELINFSWDKSYDKDESQELVYILNIAKRYVYIFCALGSCRDFFHIPSFLKI